MLGQREKRIVGSLCDSSIPLVDVPHLLELYRAGRLPIGVLIGERYSLESINDAVADLIGGGVGRAIVLRTANGGFGRDRGAEGRRTEFAPA